MFIMLIFPLCAFAGDSESLLTSSGFFEKLSEVRVSSGATSQDRGDYLVFRDSTTKKLYAFTKPGNPGHPGYLEWTLRVENGEAFLDAESHHGHNEVEFHAFEKIMNESMLHYMKGVIAGAK